MFILLDSFLSSTFQSPSCIVKMLCTLAVAPRIISWPRKFDRHVVLFMTILPSILLSFICYLQAVNSYNINKQHERLMFEIGNLFPGLTCLGVEQQVTFNIEGPMGFSNACPRRLERRQHLATWLQPFQSYRKKSPMLHFVAGVCRPLR